MMNEEQVRVVQQVLRRLTETEDENEWTTIDTCLESLQSLEDKQLVIEAQVVYESHRNKGVKCNIMHERSECFAPKIVEAADAIISLYEKTKNLHKANRYILEYYITLVHLKVIQTA